MSFKVIIPARYDSKRLPGKALRKMAGKPLIQHVYERAIQARAEQIIIATDDNRIADAAKRFGAEVCMTKASHRNGSERIQEVCEQYRWSDKTVVVNIQGDEPFTPAQAISQVAKNLLSNSKNEMSTLCEVICDPEQINDPNVVKVIFNDSGRAIYFSRAAIPYCRAGTTTYYRHLGIYAYTVKFLQAYAHLSPSEMETAERLEQLRALYYGYQIHVAVTGTRFPPGIDTEEDLQRAEQYLLEQV